MLKLYWMECLAGMTSSSVLERYSWRWCSFVHVDTGEARPWDCLVWIIGTVDYHVYSYDMRSHESIAGPKTVYIAERRGPITEPWGTLERGWDVDIWPCFYIWKKARVGLGSGKGDSNKNFPCLRPPSQRPQTVEYRKTWFTMSEAPKNRGLCCSSSCLSGHRQ